jgi:hypothetical protein
MGNDGQAEEKQAFDGGHLPKPRPFAAVVGAIGGGVGTTVFDPTKSDAFGYYSVGH